MRLERRLGALPDAKKICEEIEASHANALMELRVFTYLLHPPELAHDGLKAAIQEFLGGFARRTGLSLTIRLPDEIDEIPQRPAALDPADRPRGAHERSSPCRRVTNRSGGEIITSSHLLVRIEDDGHGLAGADTGVELLDPPDGRWHPGGMRARLRQFDGELRIKSGPYGTTVLAWVPAEIGTRLAFAARAPFRSAALREVL